MSFSTQNTRTLEKSGSNRASIRNLVMESYPHKASEISTTSTAPRGRTSQSVQRPLRKYKAMLTQSFDFKPRSSNILDFKSMKTSCFDNSVIQLRSVSWYFLYINYSFEKQKQSATACKSLL